MNSTKFKYGKEVLYLYRNIGYSAAITYIVYRLKLKFTHSKSAIHRRKNKGILLEKINEHLFVYNNGLVKIKQNFLIEIKEDNRKIWLRPFSSDRKVYDQIFKKQEYKPVIHFFSQFFVESPRLIIDLGGNIGLASVYFSALFPNAKIFAVEPFGSNIELAEKNMTENISKFKLIKGGVWTTNTTLGLNRKFRDGKEWSINLIEDEKGEVAGFSLLDLLNEIREKESVDILKIDIEGTEKKLFEDKEYASNFLKNIKCLAIEIHDEFDCRQTIIEILKNNSFIYFESGETTIAINKNFIHFKPFYKLG
ncbi:MAG: FkbM family methyltransferase [Ginsengibacter sp.]